MHTYLPTMAHLVEKAEGKVVGLRGDGLFAAFGVTELTGTGTEVPGKEAGNAAQNAVRCGKAMIEAVKDAINPTLHEGGINGDLAIGVGVDVGNVVITRIGWETASEVTAYGPPVNRACKKLAAKVNNAVRISKGVKNIYPSGKAGKVRFSFFSEGFTVDFPNDMFMLRRSASSPQKRKPR